MNGKKKKSKKKIVVILFSILAVILISGAVIAAWQWNNITAAKYYVTYSPDEINEKLEDNEQRIESAIKGILPMTVKDLTDEEKSLMASNEISKEEAVQLLVERSKKDISSRYDSMDTSVDSLDNQPAVEQSKNNDLPAYETANTAVEELPDDTNSELTELIAEVYVLRAYFTNRLEEMRTSAINEYTAQNQDKKTESMKMEIGLNYMSLAGELESECDGLMDDLVARIEAELRRSGGSTSIIKDIKSCYAEEKSLKKAYYLSLYN